MQKDFKNIPESVYYQPGNQMIYQAQLQQLPPNLSSQPQPSLMQGPLQTQGRTIYSNSAESPQLRGPIAARMPQYGTASYMTSGYTQGQPEVSSAYSQYQVQQQAQYGMQQFPYQYQPPRSAQYPPQVYVVQPASYPSMVPQMQTTQNHQIQNSPRQLYPAPQQQSPQIQMNINISQQQAPEQQQQQPKKRTTIKLTDPNTGKDLTSEILKKKPPSSSTPPAKDREENIKAKTGAKFAALVAEKIAGSSPSQSERGVIMKPSPPPKVPSNENVVVDEIESEKIVDKPSNIPCKESVPKTGEPENIIKGAEEDLNKESEINEEIVNIEEDSQSGLKEEINKDNISTDIVEDMKENAEKDVSTTVETEVIFSAPKNEIPPSNDKDELVEHKAEELIDNISSVPVGNEEVITESKDDKNENILEIPSEIPQTDYKEELPEINESSKSEIPPSVKVMEPKEISLTESVNTEPKENLKCTMKNVNADLKTDVIKMDITEPTVKEIIEKPFEKEVATSEPVKNEKPAKNEKHIRHEKPNLKEDIKKEVPMETVEKDINKITENKESIKKLDVLKGETNLEQLKNTESLFKEEILKTTEPAKDIEFVKTKDRMDEFVKTKDQVNELVKTKDQVNELVKTKDQVKPKDPPKTVNLLETTHPTAIIEPLKNAERKKVEPNKKDSKSLNEPILNGHDESVKPLTTNPVAKKKKGKSRYKEFDAKESVNNNDMLSAYSDAPAKTASESPAEVKAVNKSPPEEATWEDKENSIEKEDIRGEDAEELEAAPKRVENRIIRSEDNIGDSEKHQYDREFLLQFQFAPICTSKPAGLPNIDIVLDEAHGGTKALVPGQRISSASANDFMPTFMRQGSGSRNTSAGGRNSKDRSRGSQSSNQVRPQKVIQAPQFVKVELKKTENSWVRPSEKAKDMSDDDKALFELNRSVCSILNKLTPQKFKTLVNQMMALKIDSSSKLESAINLIFEKAIGEPGFSVAYANMCRVLTDQFNKVPVNPEKPDVVVTFRKLLLNKCQTEFEKESSDEKALEADRAKTFDTEVEKKAWLEQLDYREMMNRRRMLGNIRFIGELYKLKMISETIMHDCIYKLLRAEKQDSLEDQLECLCKLLTTIGKDLDHAKAKPRMDQYFDQMHKIIEKRKLSSRIKFALKDVIELRQQVWIPRRDDGNPKTIDQIHREAQQKEKENDMARQQEKIQRKLEPKGNRGGGGRDSPSVRTGGQPQSSDGWNTVASKSGRQTIAAAPVDASKFRVKKFDTSDISLGPGGGGRAGAWSKGASGGGSGSRSGSGSNTPTSEIDQRGNRYDILGDSAGPEKGRSGSRQMTPNRKGSSSTGHGSQRKGGNEEHSAALRAVRDMTGTRHQSPGSGRSSRNQSPGPGRSSRNQSPAPSSTYDGDSSSNTYPSRGQTPSASPNPITEEKMRKVTKSTVDEYLSCKDEKEAMLCLRELESPALHNVFVEEAVIIVIEKKPEHRRIAGSLLCRMVKGGLINVEQMCQGFTVVVESAGDFAVDIPLIYKYLGEVLGPIIYDGTLPLNKLKDILKPLIQENKAGIVMAEALSGAVQESGKEESILSLWVKSQITWNMLLRSGENMDQFIKDKKMEFTLKSYQQSPTPNHTNQIPTLSHASQIQEEMLRILNNTENCENNNELISYIEKNTDAAERKSTAFIEQLTKAVCSSSIDSSNKCECNKGLLSIRKNVLLKYIDGSKELELHSVYALQLLTADLKQPKGLLTVLFQELYEGDIISEETIFTWEKSKEYPVGKGAALSSVKDFLTWLLKADEESNDEDPSTSLTNVA